MTQINSIYVGKKYNMLTVLSVERELIHNKYVYFAICRCDCGNIKKAHMNSVRRDTTKSCGCLIPKPTNFSNKAVRKRRDHQKNKILGLESLKEMRRRCYNPKDKGYPNYGGRGIKICDRWMDKINGRRNFLNDMGKRPSLKHSIDRIDNDRDYTPENCRWVTAKEQCRNKRNNILIGEKNIDEIAKEQGLPYEVVQGRRAGLKWTDEEILRGYKNRKCGPKNKKLWNGLTINEYAGKLGINSKTLRYRISRGWTKEEIERGNNGEIIFEKMTMKDLIKKFGGTKKSINEKIKRGWTLEDFEKGYKKILSIYEGQRFGRLLVISVDKGSCFCKCSCGNYKDITLGSLKSGGTKSCGCLYNERNIIIGGKTTTEIAKEQGIIPDKVLKRLRRGWTEEEILRGYKEKKKKESPVKDFCEKHEVSLKSYYYRLKNGWTEEEIIQGHREGRKKNKHRSVKKFIKEEKKLTKEERHLLSLKNGLDEESWKYVMRNTSTDFLKKVEW